MKPVLILIISCLCFSSAYSQSVLRSTLASSGSSESVVFNGESYFVSQSIGQASVTGTSSKNGITIRQGYQQPPYAFGNDQKFDGRLNAVVYPNPFLHSITISFQENLVDDVAVKIYDVLGQIFYEHSFPAAKSVSFPLLHIPAGEYILKVISNNKELTATLMKR